MNANVRTLMLITCGALLFVDVGAAQRQNMQQQTMQQRMGPARPTVLKRYAAKRAAQGPGPESAVPVRRAVNAVLGLGWEAVQNAGSDEVRIESRISAGPSFEKLAPTSVADAWEKAHELRRTNAFSRVEPVFSGTMFAASQNAEPPLVECTPEWTDPETLPVTLPSAAKDSHWSLAATNVPAAWALFAPLNKAPGAGAIVAHPDTGFREHPAIFATDAAGNRNPLIDDGYDFILNQRRGLDIAEDGALQWPGHGTRTGSVIVARRDFQLSPTGTRTVSGIAGGARLIPLRVASRVVLLDVIEADMDNLAAAIRAAAIGDPNYVDARAHIISMSLGGAPSRAVRDALKVAQQQNVIVLAAAGNQVPTRAVVWPARYDGVIAIAASNADNKPWIGSSAGSKIAITAPGESVWVASRRFKEQTPHDCVVTATGTSYAVATTAGIAALWVSYHADKPTFQALTNRGAAFAEVLKRGFRQVNGWDTSKYGPGIVDAKKVLEEPIPQISSGPAAPACEDAEAAASLFEKNGSARLAQLLGFPSDEMCRLIQHLGDELAFHYAVNPSVQAAFERYNAVSSPNLGHMNNLRAALLAHEFSPTLSSALRKVMP